MSVRDQSSDTAAVLAAIATRRSVRGYTDKPVPRSVIEEILRASARAPSATNTQPWNVIILTGRAKEELTSAILEACAANPAMPAAEYAYYPQGSWPEPYLSRRRKIGWDLYGLLGIGKAERAKSDAWTQQNFRFFGAPVGMIFTLDRRLGLGSYLDLGMFLQNIMVAARGFGLDTCAQAVFGQQHAVVRKVLAIDEQYLVICGMSLGWTDQTAVANRLVTDREPLEAFASFRE